MKKIVAILMAMMLVISVTVVLAGGVDKGTQQSKVPVIIGFKDKPSQADKDMVRGQGGEIKHSYTIIDAIAAKLPEQAIENIQKNSKVAYVEMDGEVHAHDIELYNSWGVEHIGAGIVHDGGNTGDGVKVAIIDTGINYNHPDLSENYAGGYDFVNDDDDPMDDAGHGTHCAGIVAAVDNGAGVVGVAPDAHLYGFKVLDSSGSGYLSDAIAGIDAAVGDETDIISMSFGSSSDLESMGAACDAAYGAGIVLVASAGNSGNPPARGDNVGYPARYDSVIAVAATDSNDIRARWSSTGPAVELAAPGVGIYSTYMGVGYVTMSGTSMACPHVAGTAALVIYSGIADNGAVRTCLQETADDLGAIGRDNLYGYGLVDADEAAMPTEPNTQPVADAGGSYTGMEDVAITFDGSGSSDSDGDSLAYAWDFGDGSTGTSVNPTHTYTAGGIYTVTLVVNDGKEDSESSTTTADITEVNDPPVAEAGSDQNVVVGGVVTFDGSGSYDLDGTITDYVWEFGDETTETGITTTHTYGTAGTYSAVLTVTDNDGLTSTDTAIVTVVTEVPAYTMHIDSIDMSTDSKTRGRNTFVWAVATVTIVDESGSPVEGATVSGQWSDATSDSDSGVTDANGNVALKSDRVKDATGTFTFTVDTVTKDGWEYDPEANGVDPPSGSIPV
ncbi:MAG: S8 family serine peptidase [Halobacteriota archaeon]